MEIGIGLPAALRGVDGATVIAWARRADELGFSSLGLVDRVVFDNYDSLLCMAAAAAVTERIRLNPTLLLAPLHQNHTLLAKQAASLDRLSNGRFVLAMGVGRRPDDYQQTGVDFHRRGAQMDQLVARLKAVWRGEAGDIGPRPLTAGGPPLILGGSSAPAFRRAAREAVGWICSGGAGDIYRSNAEQLREAWAEAGRTEPPRVMAITYFTLGPFAQERASEGVRDYYAFLGPAVENVLATVCTSEEAVRARMGALEDAGYDELIFLPFDQNPDQVERLRQVTAD